jgi:hypothetical protein
MEDRDWHTFRDIDAHLGLPKGSAFRGFKRLHDALEEGRDFHLLSATEHGQTIEQLRRQSRIYASSINVVLLSGPARARIETLIASNTPTGKQA